jgi:hypothetical protein
MSPEAQGEKVGSKEWRSITELNTLEFSALMTLAVRNGVLQAFGVLLLISFLLGFVVFMLRTFGG